MLASHAEGRGFDPQPGQMVISIFSPVTSGTQCKKSEMRSFKSNENIHKKEGGSYVNHPIRWAWWPFIEWLLKLRFGDESKIGGGICSSVRYIALFYRLAVQAGFCGDAVECWLHMRRIVGSILSRDKLCLAFFTCYTCNGLIQLIHKFVFTRVATDPFFNMTIIIWVIIKYDIGLKIIISADCI